MIYATAQGERVPALRFGTYLLYGAACRAAVADALAVGYRHTARRPPRSRCAG